METIETASPRSSLGDTEFKRKLEQIIPHLRAFARSLCGNRDLADDLVQDTMLKAWAARERFEPDTNFRAWTFTILRNHYYSQTRRNRFVGEWDDLVADRILAAPAKQDDSIQLGDILRALQELPPSQREALILVGAGGLSYEETAEITGVALGTVKSRVSRGRIALEAAIEGGLLTTRRAEMSDDMDPVLSIFAIIEDLRARATNGNDYLARAA